MTVTKLKRDIKALEEKHHALINRHSILLWMGRADKCLETAEEGRDIESQLEKLYQLLEKLEQEEQYVREGHNANNG